MESRQIFSIGLLIGLATLSYISSGADLGTMEEIGTIDGKRILISDEQLNFYQAYRLCRQIGGWLMTVENANENNLVVQYLMDNGYWVNGESAWVGAWRVGEDGTTAEYYYWLNSAESLSTGYTNWQAGEPDDLDGAQDCLQLYSSFNYTWDDAQCQFLRHAVCEIEQSTVSTCSSFTASFTCAD